MNPEAVLAIDQGTTNSKAILVSRDGTMLAKGSSPVKIDFPKPGWVEQDARDIWHSVLDAIDRCLGERADTDIVSIGISNQRESVVAWGPDDRRTTGSGYFLAMPTDDRGHQRPESGRS